jgi:hypothetical protein
MKINKKLLASAAVFLAGSCMLALAQITTPAVQFNMSMDGQPVISVPNNLMVGGPVASALQDASQVTAPAYTSGGCSATPSAVAGDAFVWSFTDGAATCGSSLVMTFPAAAHKWVCDVHDVTTPASNTIEQSTSASTTAVTFVNYVRTTGIAGNFTASDVLVGKCLAY